VKDARGTGRTAGRRGGDRQARRGLDRRYRRGGRARRREGGGRGRGRCRGDAALRHRLHADRELPIIWRIAKGSLFNKLVIILPVALLLTWLLPWAITPLLMLGGAYLCYEGAEKIWHSLIHKKESLADKAAELNSPDHEKLMVAGAIRTDFILSRKSWRSHWRTCGTIPTRGQFWLLGAGLAPGGGGDHTCWFMGWSA
jgi:hypothetical protein